MNGMSACFRMAMLAESIITIQNCPIAQLHFDVESVRERNSSFAVNISDGGGCCFFLASLKNDHQTRFCVFCA